MISPAGSQELHEVESVAIDPANPQIIYAGTWHLPWKTTDGGEHWTNIKQGVIDDSDVFSIIVDPKDRSVVYASACSGIYKSQTGREVSEGAGNTFDRAENQGADAGPSEPEHSFCRNHGGSVPYRGLGRDVATDDRPEVIVNDVYVDPTNTNRFCLRLTAGVCWRAMMEAIRFFQRTMDFLRGRLPRISGMLRSRQQFMWGW